METREFEQISTDIREYTLRFQESMLRFLRDVIIRRMYLTEEELEKALEAYNRQNSQYGILNEDRDSHPMNASVYGRMDLAGAMKILRFLENSGNQHISQRFLDTFEIREQDTYSRRLKTGNESRNIFAHYNKNKKVTFTKENMQQSMLFFINMFEDIVAIRQSCTRFDEKGRAKYLEEKKEALEDLKKIYDEARLHTNLLPYTVDDISLITGADEKQVRMAVEYYDLVREGKSLYADDRSTVQAMIESLRTGKIESQIESFFPVAREKKTLSDAEMAYAAAKTAVIIDYSALVQKGTIEYLYRYAQFDFQRFDTCFYIDVNSLEKLRQAAYNTKRMQKANYRQNAKEAFKKISELKEFLRVQYIHDTTSVETDAASVLGKLSKEVPVCFLTGDREKIEQLWESDLPNVAILSADTQGRLGVNLAKEHQVVANEVLGAVEDIRVDEERMAAVVKEESKQEEDSSSEIIKIPGGVPSQGLYAPRMDLSFKYYEPKSESGAEGTVYQTNYGDYVIKIYHENMNTVSKREKVCEMVQKEVKKDFICWPEDALYSSKDGEFVGYVMKQVKNPESLYARIEELDLISQDEKSRESVSRISLMEYCKKIAEQFFELHRNDIYVGDVNENNILISKDDDEIYFVDTDSYQFAKYVCPVGQELYASPEYISTNSTNGNLTFAAPRTRKDEQFSMAVMFYRILFLGASPFKMENGHVVDAISNHEFSFFAGDTELDDSSFQSLREGLIWNGTSPHLRELFVKTFRTSSRFKPEEWIDAFNLAENEIFCGNYSKELIPGLADYLKNHVTEAEESAPAPRQPKKKATAPAVVSVPQRKTESAPKQPVPKQPAPKQPEIRQPAARQPKPMQPEAGQPVTRQQIPRQPEAKQPATGQQTPKQPEAKQPVTRQQSPKQPAPTQQAQTSQSTQQSAARPVLKPGISIQPIPKPSNQNQPGRKSLSSQTVKPDKPKNGGKRITVNKLENLRKKQAPVMAALNVLMVVLTLGILFVKQGGGQLILQNPLMAIRELIAFGMIAFILVASARTKRLANKKLLFIIGYTALFVVATIIRVWIY